MTSPSGKDNIEDAYALSPMQEGMLFHTLYAPDSGIYFEQLHYTLRGSVNPNHLRDAWQGALERHAVLRTAFAWRNVERPLQVVGRRVKLDWQFVQGNAALSESIETILRADIEKGFDLSRAPLLRVRLYEREANRHELIVSFHHILLDMWSYSLLEKEVFADYEARLEGRVHEFIPPRPYRDFINRLGSRDPNRGRDFWREQLGDFRGGISPAGAMHGNSNAPGSGFGETQLELNQADSKSISAFARENRLTLNTLLSGAWALLLKRHTRENDVLFGLIVSGRPAEMDGFESMVGLFINTLPVRMQVSEELPPAEWLREIQQEQSKLRAYEDTPLTRIPEWIDAGDKRSLFDSIIVVENIPDSVRGNAKTGFEIESIAAFERTNYPLTLVFHPGEKFRVLLKYERPRFDEASARTVLEQLERILLAFAEPKTRRISEISLLPEKEHEKILRESHTDTASSPDERVIHAAFSRIAAKFPTHPALSYQGERLSYAELETQSNRLAHYLLNAGAGPGAIVGLCMSRTPEMLVAMLAILKSGGAYLPLDPRYPAERLDYIISDTNPHLVLVDEESLNLNFPAASRVIAPSREQENINTLSDEQPGAPADPRGLAYIIYTSGSTGKPKGVMVEHGDVIDLFESARSWAGYDESDVWTLYHSVSFDFSVWEIWGALLFGGRLEIVDYWTSRSPGDTADLVRREGVTIFNQTPSAFQQFMEQGGDYPSLRMVIFGGEALDPKSLRPWFERHGERAELVNMFGITETIVHVTYHKLKPAALDDGRNNIGRPLAGKRLYILDEFQNPTPPGVAGEIFVGGKGVARGYWNRPDLTNERFPADPYSEPDRNSSRNDESPRMYRSGDLGRRLSDGTIEYLGRADDQIKVRGFRIEPGEIEAVLTSHEAVAQATVLAREDEGDKYIAAYIVRREPALTRHAGEDEDIDVTEEANTNKIQTHAARILPEHMLPARYVFIDQMPLTRNGKIDKRALPAPGARRLDKSTYEAPADDIERTLALVWSEILKVEKPGRNDDFFKLGGDSILSIRLVSRAAKEGLKFTPRDVFEKATIAGLAATIREVDNPVEQTKSERTEGSDSRKGGPGAADGGDIPLTPIIRWFTDLKSPNRNLYNMVFAFRPQRRLDPGRCGTVLDILIKRHDALRLRLARDRAGNERLSTAAVDAISPVAIKLRELTTENDISESVLRASEEIQTTINLEQGPLLNAAYLRGPTESDDRLILGIHHIAMDGVSWRILTREFQEIYEELESNQEPALVSDATSFAEWAHRPKSDAPTPSATAYWARQKNRSAIPLDLKGGVNLYTGERIIARNLEADSTHALTHDVPARGEYRTQEILVGALVETLLDWSGGSEIALHLESHGRSVTRGPDPSHTIGWFTVLYPLLFRGGENSARTLRGVRRSMRTVPDGTHEHIKGENETEPEIIFNYLGRFDGDESFLNFAPESVSNGRDPGGRRPHVLEINCFIHDGELRINWHYGENLHRANTIESLASEFLKRIRGLTALAAAKPRDDVYALAPTQAGMLAESMFFGEGDMHVEQIHATLRGAADPATMKKAWELVLWETPVLRTGFRWRENEAPEQFIAPEPELDFTEIDLRDIRTPAEKKEKLGAYLRESRGAGFDFHRPPLMRTALIRFAAEEYVLVWTFHHILMDGWCLFPILKRVFALYESLIEGGARKPEAAPSYRDYIEWLRSRDESSAAAFFREKLAAMPPASLPGRSETAPRETANTERHARLDLGIRESTRRGLETFARENRLTLNSVIQGIWALLLARYSGGDDVVFGVTVSGRPPEMAGIEKTIGLFINTLPVRIAVPPERDAVAFMNTLQEYNLELRRFEYVAGEDVREWSGLAPTRSLFESILVYENYPFEPESFEGAGLRFDMDTLESTGATTHYALTLLILPGREFQLRAIHDTRRMQSADVERVLNHMALLMKYIAASPRAKVAECLALIPDKEIPVVALPEGKPFEEPRGETEEKLAQIFRETLELEKVGRHDDFFELGGDSFLAMNLAASINGRFDHEIKMSSLLSGGSIAELARTLEQIGENTLESISLSSSFVTIQAKGTRPPLYLVHPAGASPLCYGLLARLLGRDQPVHGLQPRGLEDDEPFITTVEEMAAHYIQEIRARHKSGPYRLGGWSMGGILAYEMAVQLSDAGQEVDFVGLIDITVEDHGDFVPWLFIKAAMFALKSMVEQELPRDWKELRHMMNFVGLNLPEDPLKFITDAKLPDPAQWRSTLAQLSNVAGRFYPIYIINMIAPMIHKPRKYSGPVDLFRVPPYIWERPDPVETKLREYAQGGVRVHTIAGNHMTLMNLENVPALAEQFRARLEELNKS